MIRRVGIVAALVALSAATFAVPTAAGVTAGAAHCGPGARTLSSPGTRVYPDVGNGGYRSLHTDVHLVYDNATDEFVTGNHVELRDVATRCLTSFSLDFERHSINRKNGPNMKVASVWVDGRRVHWSFVRPTYPGDPNGINDPNPRVHQASQFDPVGGPHHNPLPPACSPELPEGSSAYNSRNGTMCPRSKLVVTPGTPIQAGKKFTVTVYYTGRPGVHNDGDGTTDGWFRATDGGFVTTEPMGTEDWMPLNNYPAAKPTYDFFDTVPAGATAICNGILEGTTSHPSSKLFPNGSTTFHWHEQSPVASYLVENSIGNYTMSERTADNGVHYYTVQDSNLSPAQASANQAVISQQEDITDYESLFNGSYPFVSDGVIVGTPAASFEEEMETMITFAGGGPVDTPTLYHENMHQWWGDNVTEGSFSMTFFKEGMATLAEYLYTARTAETAAGGSSNPAGQQAFQHSLVSSFNQGYESGDSFWTHAPSKPTAASLFSYDPTYQRPGISYIALRQILGPTRFVEALHAIQHQYGGASITEPQLEAAYQHWLPDQKPACHERLSTWFKEWWDTGYPAGGGSHRPAITGPGLEGTNFYGTAGCP